MSSRPHPAPRLARNLDHVASVALAAWIAATPLLHGATDADTRAAFRLGVIVVAVLGSLAASLRGRIRLPPWWLTLSAAAYMVLTGLAAWNSPYSYGSWQAAFDTVLVVGAFFFAVGMVSTRWQRWLVLGGFLAGSLAMAVLGLSQAAGASFMPPPPEGRVSSLFDNPNHFAGLLDMAAPLSLALFLFARNGWLRVASLILAAIFYFSLGLTYSYGGWFASGSATILLLAAWAIHGLAVRRSAWPMAGAVALVGIALTVGFVFVDNSPRLRGDTMQRIQALTDVAGATSLPSRRAIHGASWAMALDHPWLGVGPGTYEDRIVAYRPEQVNTRADRFLHRTVRHALNDYLNVASTAGLPALAAFGLFWLLVAVKIPRQSSAIGFGISAALVALLLHGIVDGNLTYVTSNAFLGFALAGILHTAPDTRAQRNTAEGPA